MYVKSYKGKCFHKGDKGSNDPCTITEIDIKEDQFLDKALNKLHGTKVSFKHDPVNCHDCNYIIAVKKVKSKLEPSGEG